MAELSADCGCPEAVLEIQRNQALGCLAGYSRTCRLFSEQHSDVPRAAKIC